jgi:hypothetical protein
MADRGEEAVEKKLRKSLVGAMLAFVFGLGAFFRMPGAENVRAVQIVSLLASGMGLGVAWAHFWVLRGLKSRN